MASGRHWLPSKPAARQQTTTESSIAATPFSKQHNPNQHHYQHYSVAAIYHHSHQIQPVQDHNFNVLENLPSNNKEHQLAKVCVVNRDDGGIQQRNAARLM